MHKFLTNDGGDDVVNFGKNMMSGFVNFCDLVIKQHINTNCRSKIGQNMKSSIVHYASES